MTSVARIDVIDEGRTLVIDWCDGTRARFHSFWLLDNAQDENSRSQQNGQRLISVLDLPGDPRINGATLGPDDSVRLGFAQPERQLVFSANWLAQYRYDCDQPRTAGWTAAGIERWDEQLNAHVPDANFVQARSDRSVLAEWLAAIQRFGFAKMHGVPCTDGALCEVAELFGFVRETNYGRYFDVRSEVNPVNLAYTGLGLQAHSDNPYRDPVPTLQIISCLENTADGGESLVIDAFKAVEQLAAESPQHLQLLSQHCARFEYAGTDDVCLRAKRPVIELGADGELLGVRFNNRSVAPLVDIGFDEMPAYYAAYRRFAEIITQPQMAVSFKLQAGELFIVDNTRVLHSRKAFSGAGTRHLQGCYTDKDGLLSTLQVLKNQSADLEEFAA